MLDFAIQSEIFQCHQNGIDDSSIFFGFHAACRIHDAATWSDEFTRLEQQPCLEHDKFLKFILIESPTRFWSAIQYAGIGTRDVNQDCVKWTGGQIPAILGDYHGLDGR